MCLVTSFAMALDLPVEEIIRLIGHDGSEHVFQRAEPMCRRGHHADECVFATIWLRHSATPVELFPAIGSTQILGMPDYEVPVLYGSLDGNWQRFTHLIKSRTGVLEGSGFRCGHAVAFHKGRIFDPDGREYDYSREACELRGFYGRKLWLIQKNAT